MPLTQDERGLHTMAIEGIRTGGLPNKLPKATWAGNGSGQPCALCQKRIERSDVEYEVQDVEDRVFLFHLRCHAIWQLALSAHSRTSSPPQPGGMDPLKS